MISLKTSMQLLVLKYFDFKTRSSRGEFWRGSVILTILINLFFKMVDNISEIDEFKFTLIAIITLIMFIPLFSLSVRRLHDINKSGYWFFIAFIPVIGNIIMFYWGCVKGSEGNNKYGPNPLDIYK